MESTDESRLLLIVDTIHMITARTAMLKVNEKAEEFDVRKFSHASVRLLSE
jgi:hypothetical protein